MNQVMISLAAPVSTDKVEPWVKEQLERLRGEATASGVRLGPLAPACLPHEADWLVGVGREDRDVRLDDAALNLVMTDLALLGLRPQLLVAAGRATSEISHAHASSPPVLAPPNNS